MGDDVALTLIRDAHIVQNDVEDFAIQRSAVEKADRRELQALLIDLCRSCRKAARYAATDVGPVTAVGEKGDEFPSVEKGTHHFDVHQVRAAKVGDVDDVDVTRGGVLDALDNRPDRVTHHVDEIRQAARALHDHLAGLALVDAAGAIEAVGDHR